MTNPSRPYRYNIPATVRGGGSFSTTHNYILDATPADLEGMADQLLAEVGDDEDGTARLCDFAMGCFGLQKWKVGLRIAYAVRPRSPKYDRRLRFWALREVVNWSPLIDPRRPWPPTEIPAALHAELDVVALLVFGLEGHPESWRDDPRLASVARTVVEAINQPWRMVR